jgi:hypothetical protein
MIVVMCELGNFVLPIAIAILGSVTSILIAVSGNRSRRQEIDAARAARLAERGEDRRDRDRQLRVEAVESVIDEIVDFADSIDALRKSLRDKPEQEVSSAPRPHDFKLRAAIARIATRGRDREISVAAEAVLHAAQLRDVRKVPEALGPLQTALERWLQDDVPREDVLEELKHLRDEQNRRAGQEDRLQGR